MKIRRYGSLWWQQSGSECRSEDQAHRRPKLLLENIKKLGKIGSKVKVANGFARNYLLRNNKALIASKENLEIFEKRKEELNKKNNELKNEASKIQKEIDKFELKITKNAMEGGALYGSLTIKEIIQNLETHNFKNILPNMIELKEQIKKIGDYTVIINLHADVQASIKVKVVSVEKIIQSQVINLSTLILTKRVKIILYSSYK